MVNKTKDKTSGNERYNGSYRNQVLYYLSNFFASMNLVTDFSHFFKFSKVKNATFRRSIVVCISLEMRSVAKQVSVAIGWVKIKISLMAQLKGLTAKFKLM